MKKQNRENVYEQLKIDEGVVYAVYKDHLGYLTFGVGHLITDKDEEWHLPEGYDVDEKRVKEAFEQDLDIAISECKVLYAYDWDDWPSEIQEVLVNMMFNLGRPRLSKFKNFKAALERRDWQTAAEEMKDSRWYNQVGARAERLCKRVKECTA